MNEKLKLKSNLPFDKTTYLIDKEMANDAWESGDGTVVIIDEIYSNVNGIWNGYYTVSKEMPQQDFDATWLLVLCLEAESKPLYLVPIHGNPFYAGLD